MLVIVVPVSIPPSKDISQDIPPARRQATEISLQEIENLQLVSPKKKSRALPAVMSIFLLAGLGALGYWQQDRLQPRFARMKEALAAVDFSFLKRDERNTSAEGSNGSQRDRSDSVAVSDSTSTSSAASASNRRGESVASSGAVSAEDVPEQLLNHRRYEVRDPATLVPLNSDSRLLLAPDAQAAITEMIEKAKAEGVQLGVISGFRTLADQDYLYFDLKAERGQSAQTRAEVSAPPGYSEHHTGYAADFIDESKPDTHLEESFETTAAFRWMEKNAAFFNFELSFPKENEANVSYEPWHWRYVGNQESLELFYK
ncbi:MAG: M15 family metallopeptidase [Cyanobacteria bacterium J06621_11]